MVYLSCLLFVPNSSELIVTLVIIAILFGGKKIPELAKGLGQGIREFNEAKNGTDTSKEATAIKPAEKDAQ